MCQGDDRDCPEFEQHRRQLLDELGHERRAFLKSAVAAAGGISAAAGGLSLVTPAMAQAAEAAQPAKRGYHYLPATAAIGAAGGGPSERGIDSCGALSRFRP